MSIVRSAGELLVVPEGARIPKVCLKCGATKDVVRREQPYVVGMMGKSAPWVGAGVGVGVSSFVRSAFHDDRAMQAIAIGVICAVAIVVAVVMQQAARKVELSLPLCAEHDAQLEAARRRRAPLLAGVGLALLLGLVGLGVESIAMALAAVGVIVLLVLVARAMKMNEAWVHAQSVTDDHVALRIGASLASSIAERAAKRAAKRAAG